VADASLDPGEHMRRLATAIAAASLALSAVGSALAVEPVDPGPAPIVESPPPESQPSVDPRPSSQPDASPAADPTTDPTATPEPSATTAPDESEAPVVPSSEAAKAHEKSAKPGPRSATDPTDRWIVVLKPGTDAVATADRQGKRIGFDSDRTYRRVIRGYSAHLERAQVTALSRDPSVEMIVADEVIHAEAQTLPTGVSRINGRAQKIAPIDGLDDRVDADVAIVDTGVTRVPDLNVVGGYNCSTSTTTAWGDGVGHGTHVAGTVGAIDDGNGVVGVAPGVRIWSVRILDTSGEGLLSWYVCGLDWIAAQRDPNDPSRPLFEAANMSVAKWGSDDRNCGLTNKDILHQAICRLVASGVTVVVAAGNDSGSASARVPAAYNEVITVSALADTDGRSGGLGGHRCLSWGSYDVDDTFADFSNFGSDVDLIAPGKCIWSTVPGGYKYSSGTSMATPHVTGAVALLKASRPNFTPAEVREALQYLGTLNWRTSTDKDAFHEKLLDVSRIGPRGDFSLSAGANVIVGEPGGAARFPITIARTPTSFERIRLTASNVPAGWGASFDVPGPYGFTAVSSTLTVSVPAGTTPGTYTITVAGDEHGRTRSATARIVVENDPPTAQPPLTVARAKATVSDTIVPTTVAWHAATDPSSPIGGYEIEQSVAGGSWVALGSTTGTVRTAPSTQVVGRSYQYRVRARDAVGNWSAWAPGATVTAALISDRAAVVTYSGTWRTLVYANALGGTTRYSTSSTARARTTFTGRGVAIIAPVGPTRGRATVYVDGVYRGTVNFRASAGASRRVMFSTAWTTAGTHTIELRVGTTGRVDLDGFVILR
jgi:subtilisin